MNFEKDYKYQVLTKGYTIFKNALSTREVELLREKLLNYFKVGDFIYIFSGKAKPDAFNTNGLRG